MKHVLIVKDNDPNITLLEEMMQGYNYEIARSHYEGHASDIVQSYDTPVRFYACGGDGLVNQVVKAVIGTDHEMAIVPLGTGNDTSRFVNQTTDAKEALAFLKNAGARLCDVLKVNDTCCINSACWGIDAVVANHVHDVIDVPLLPAEKSYVISILRNIAGYDFPDAEVTADGEPVYSGPVTVFTAMNGRYYGGGFEIAPFAHLDDGKMDVIILGEIQKRKAPVYVREILRRRFHKRQDVLSFRCHELTVKTSASMNVDGDELKADVYRVSVIPDALKLVSRTL